MDDIEITEQLVAVWKSMADHFLDTENREGIPQTALLCVGAGLTVEEAHEVWLREVSPVVGANLLSVAGEWAGWDEEWLVTKVRARALRRRAQRRGKPLSKLLSRFRVDLNRGVWRSIERCLRLLEATPPEQRDLLVQDLSLLGVLLLRLRGAQCSQARRHAHRAAPNPARDRVRCARAGYPWRRARSGP